MVSSLGERAAISCQEGSLLRKGKVKAEPEFQVRKGGAESNYFQEG